ncbi:MAG: TIGR00299 family protein [Anaerolineales bacterium]|nr:nickel pincer cofactor biosynthesis protein LarC [Anaerolineae bacterium]PWB56224.1 MAG: TIGR00299 family protein [Anaerolineales bacterium]
MKIGYLDCPSGISGDMFLSALVDCGAPLDDIKERLALLPIQGFKITSKRVNKAGLTAIQVDVLVDDRVTERKLAEIINLILQSPLSENIKGKAVEVFRRIGEVEALIHGLEVEEIHLHELGGLDTIVDVVGVLLGMELLGIDRLIASPLPLGSGTIQSAHGTLPLPAPASLALLKGVPIHGSEINKELVTPTGAALLTSLVQEFGIIPAMRLEKIGYGAGKRDLPTPNVLRLLIGESMEPTLSSYSLQTEKLVCLECNIDNMNPEIYSYLSERLFNTGALDVSLTPVYMKKNRPGSLVTVLCTEDDTEKLMEIIFSETTTLGIRKYSVDRYSVERHITQVSTPYGAVNIKFSKKGDKSWNYTPEYEDCRRLALQHNIPIQKIYRAAEFAAEEHLQNLFLAE